MFLEQKRIFHQTNIQQKKINNKKINSLHWHFTANSLTADRNIFGTLILIESTIVVENRHNIKRINLKKAAKSKRLKNTVKSCWRIFGWNFWNYRIRTIMNTLWYICNVIKIFSFLLSGKRERQRRLFIEKYYNLLENEMNCLSLKCLLALIRFFVCLLVLLVERFIIVS